MAGEIWLGLYYVQYACADDGRMTSPQCRHRFIWKRQDVNVSIDKRLLPHWKEIKTNIIQLLEEFEITDTHIDIEGQK